jgi:hypothetical protein
MPLHSKLSKIPPPSPYLFIYLLCSYMIPNNSSYLFMLDFKFVSFHVHVDVQGKGVKLIGLKEMGY